MMNVQKLTKIFRYYDRDRSESLNFNEFHTLIRDLTCIRDVKMPDNISDIVLGIAEGIASVNGEYITLQEFIDSVNRTPRHLNVFHNSGLLDVLLGPDYFPSYEEKVLPPWEEHEWLNTKYTWGLAIVQGRLGEGLILCQIHEELQVKFQIPDLNRDIQVRVRKSDSLFNLFQKICESWPGLRGRNFVAPEPSSLILKYGDEPLLLPNHSRTIENIDLFMLASTNVLSIIVSRPKIPKSSEDGEKIPEPPPLGRQRSFGKHTLLEESTNFVQDPVHSAEDALGESFFYRGDSLEHGMNGIPLKGGCSGMSCVVGGESERSASLTVFDSMSSLLTEFERKSTKIIKSTLTQLKQRYDELRLITDQISVNGELNDVDRRGLKDFEKTVFDNYEKNMKTIRGMLNV